MPNTSTKVTSSRGTPWKDYKRKQRATKAEEVQEAELIENLAFARSKQFRICRCTACDASVGSAAVFRTSKCHLPRVPGDIPLPPRTVEPEPSDRIANLKWQLRQELLVLQSLFCGDVGCGSTRGETWYVPDCKLRFPTLTPEPTPGPSRFEPPELPDEEPNPYQGRRWWNRMKTCYR